MFTLSYLLSSLTFLLALAFAAQILKERRPPGTTIAWLLLIVFVPYVGIPLYLFIGGRKLRKDFKKKRHLYAPMSFTDTPSEIATLERILLSSGVPPKTEGNRVEMLGTGEESYSALLEMIAGAQKSISLTTFIFRGDEVGRAVARALTDRAREGVRVRLLVDGFFGLPWSFRFLRELKAAGGIVAVFNPILHVPFRGHSNLRNHRKVVIFDDVKAIVGGTNIAREYIGPAGDVQRWTDLSIRLEGPAVAALNDIFREDWRYATGEDIPKDATMAPSVGECLVQVVPSGPDVPGDPLYDSIISAIFAAEKRVWVATPYFIPDETLARALELAARRGVDLKIVVPERSNHFLADLCRRSYLRQIHQAGGQICFFEPGMMHGKVTLIDHDCALIGSANMDMRSLLVNYEIGIFIYTPSVVEEIASWLAGLVHKCVPYPENEPGALIVDGIGRILGPML